MNSMKAELVRKYGELAQVEELISNYRETKATYLEQLRKQAVFGVTKGSVKYVETLLECMQLPEELPEDFDIP